MSCSADNFYRSDIVIVQLITFKNQYDMTITGNLFTCNNLDRSMNRLAIIVGQPAFLGIYKRSINYESSIECIDFVAVRL